MIFSLQKRRARDYMKLGNHYCSPTPYLSPLIQNCRTNTEGSYSDIFGSERTWKTILCTSAVHRYSFTRIRIGSLPSFDMKFLCGQGRTFSAKGCNQKGFVLLLKALANWYFLKMFAGSPWSALLPPRNAYALLTEAWLRLVPGGICLEDYKPNRRSYGTWIL